MTNVEPESDAFAKAPAPRRSFAIQAAFFELGLAGLALAIAAFFRINPFDLLRGDLASIWVALASTIPMLIALRWMLKTPWPPIRNLVTTLDPLLAELFEDSSALELAALALAAGFSEELLFRGVLQPVLERHIGVWPGIGLASVLFGLCHALTATYAIVAGVLGAYFSCLLHATGNLAVPILAHAVYDFVALVWWRRLRRMQTMPKGNTIVQEGEPS